MRRFILAVVLLVFAFTAYKGFTDGPGVIRRAANARQVVVGIGQLCYGVTALVALFGLWQRSAWTMPIVVIWGVACTIVAAVATVAWTDAGLGAALAAAGVTLVVAALVVWYVRYLLRNWQP